MIYIFSLCLCFLLTWYYDILGGTKYKQQWYSILLIWFILVSGFQYMVGTDMEEYIEKYRDFNSSLSIKTFFESAEDRQQPGWVLLSWICRQFTNDFLLLKLIQAIFINVAIFSFFKRESKYIFLCIFFYAISSYLVMNFNVLRQSFSVAFGLYAITYLKDNRYAKYLFFVFLAYMFHSSALLLLIIPLFKVLKYNKKTSVLLVLGVLGAVAFLNVIDFQSVMFDIVRSGQLGENASGLAWGYMNNDKLGTANRGFSIGIQFILRFFVVSYFIIKKKNYFIGGLGATFLLFMILGEIMPILWRFRLYFEFVYYVLLAQVIIELPQKRLYQVRRIFYIVAILLFCYTPYKDYFGKVPGIKHRYIDQYYPYHSILDPVKEERI